MTCLISNIHSPSPVYIPSITVILCFILSTTLSLSLSLSLSLGGKLFVVCLYNKMIINSLGSSEQFTAPLYLHRNAPGHFQNSQGIM